MAVVAEGLAVDEAAFRGRVLTPGEPDYDIHRKIWNGSFDCAPPSAGTAGDSGDEAGEGAGVDGSA